jgi:O-antigen/teichoic acid export membrane protein
VTFFTFGQDSAILRYFHDEGDDESRKQLISQTIIFQLMVSISALGIFLLFKDEIIGALGLSNESANLVLTLLMIVPFGICYTISEIVLRLTSDLKRYMVLTIGFMIASLLVIFYATRVMAADLDQMFTLYFYLWGLFGIFGLVLIRKWLAAPKSVGISKKMAVYGLPMGLVVLVESSQPVIERLIITNIISMEALGLYAVAAKIAIILLLPIGAFQMAFMPLVMKIHHDQNSIKLFNLVLTIYSTFLTVLVLLLCALSEPLIIFLAGRPYLGGAPVVFPLILSIYFQAIAGILGLGTIISSRTYVRFGIHLVSQIVACSLMILLSDRYNILGVACAVAAGKALILVLDGIVGQRLYPLAWNYRAVLVMAFITLVYGSYLSSQGLDSMLGMVIFMVVLVGVVFIGWSFLTSEDKGALRIRN